MKVTKKGSSRDHQTGMTVAEFLEIFSKEAEIPMDKLKAIANQFDTRDLSKLEPTDIPGYITWDDFTAWFQRLGEQRDNLHKAWHHQPEVTRLFEFFLPNSIDSEYSLTHKIAKKDVELMLHFNSSGHDIIFVVFENRTGSFFELKQTNQHLKLIQNFHMDLNPVADIREKAR